MQADREKAADDDVVCGECGLCHRLLYERRSALRKHYQAGRLEDDVLKELTRKYFLPALLSLSGTGGEEEVQRAHEVRVARRRIFGSSRGH